MSKASIHIKSRFGTFLNTREAAILLYRSIVNLNASDVEVDFTDVFSMSRSFADQFHKERQKLRNESNVSVFLVNANKNIEKMLEVVNRTQVKQDRKFNDIQVLRFSNIKDVSSLLHSI